MRDLKNNLQTVTSLAPVARNASANGAGVDLQGFDAAMISFVVGAITDGTHVPSIEESSDNSAFTAVAAIDLIGTLGNLAASTNQSIGYRGSRRYIRAVSTVSGATTGGIYAAAVLRSRPSQAPVA